MADKKPTFRPSDQPQNIRIERLPSGPRTGQYGVYYMCDVNVNNTTCLWFLNDSEMQALEALGVNDGDVIQVAKQANIGKNNKPYTSTVFTDAGGRQTNSKDFYGREMDEITTRDGQADRNASAPPPQAPPPPTPPPATRREEKNDTGTNAKARKMMANYRLTYEECFRSAVGILTSDKVKKSIDYLGSKWAIRQDVDPISLAKDLATSLFIHLTRDNHVVFVPEPPKVETPPPPQEVPPPPPPPPEVTPPTPEPPKQEEDIDDLLPF